MGQNLDKGVRRSLGPEKNIASLQNVLAVTLVVCIPLAFPGSFFEESWLGALCEHL